MLGKISVVHNGLLQCACAEMIRLTTAIIMKCDTKYLKKVSHLLITECNVSNFSILCECEQCLSLFTTLISNKNHLPL